MDRSLDSIGSCSLDVDADSSDISDTSGSLNFPTPLSVKDITREFTTNIKERCILRSPLQPQSPRVTNHSAAYINLESAGGVVRMVLSPPTPSNAAAAANTTTVDLIVDAVEKKPSYLNLACCVNGYSNLTTYDSKIRQDINKSREVSPIRPSTSSLQYCKRNNSLAAPQLHSMPLTKQPATTLANKYNETNNNNNNNHEHSNGNGKLQNGDDYYNGSHKSTSSFIQQRVERLYGPGALAQGFYSPKKHSSGQSPRQSNAQQPQLERELSPQRSELARKFKQLSPSKDYGEFRKKLHSNCTRAQVEQLTTLTTTTTIHVPNGETDLPVFRHLSHEFRAQLPTVSPKRCIPRVSPAPEVLLPLQSNGVPLDVVDHEPLKPAQLRSEEYISTTKILAAAEPSPPPPPATVSPPAVLDNASTTTLVPAPVAEVRDGTYFLKILKAEQVRLLALAATGEKYLDALTDNPKVTEDTLGLLRSAAGKARLLVAQKMKQFEGLCHNNLNRSPEDAFPTTLDDLQGFWDMVYLQVEHIDSIFADIEQLKANDWKRISEPAPASTAISKSTRTAKTTTTTKSAGNQKAKTASVNTSKVAASNSVAAMKREAQRKQLLEMKRQRREALAAAAGGGDVGAVAVAEDVAAAATAVVLDTVAVAVELPSQIGDTTTCNVGVQNSS
ncbi:vlc [Drosophila busckii]|uniref:Vlc n=1 Tax=Drosophila busckii TaxID=30019 RepID=A0A0M4EG97_DROBS|nr:uncharacterized protein LOC108596369 [Drosophila busckii]ALC41397.1 vlc [Drosophila busckii]